MMSERYQLDKNVFLRDADAKAFVDYFSAIISGQQKFEHSYYDKTKRKRIKFNRLYEGLEQYHWNREGYSENKRKIDTLIDEFANSNSDESFYQACLSTLYWGDGNKKGNLYSSNKSWLDSQDNVRQNIMAALAALLNETIDVSAFGKSYRSNAGFTKIYAFINPEDFVIYDSRVAAALSFFVILYCQHKSYKEVPISLQLQVSEAKGSQTRVLRIADSDLKFSKGTDKGHALSNVKANWLISEALEIAKRDDINRFNSIREIEAALFMIGYDFPKHVDHRTHRYSNAKECNQDKIYSYIQSKVIILPQRFNYKELIQSVKLVLPNTSRSGQDYASLKFIQKYCNPLNKRIAKELNENTDPRKISLIKTLRSKCEFELI